MPGNVESALLPGSDVATVLMSDAVAGSRAVSGSCRSSCWSGSPPRDGTAPGRAQLRLRQYLVLQPATQRVKISETSGLSALVGGIGPPASISSRLIIRIMLLFRSPGMTFGSVIAGGHDLVIVAHQVVVVFLARAVAGDAVAFDQRGNMHFIGRDFIRRQGWQRRRLSDFLRNLGPVIPGIAHERSRSHRYRRRPARRQRPCRKASFPGWAARN